MSSLLYVSKYFKFFPLGIQTANLLGAKLQYGTQAHDAPTPENKINFSSKVLSILES